MKKISILLLSVFLFSCGEEAPVEQAQTVQNEPEMAPAENTTVTQGRMLQPRALIHVVADLEPSVEFYRDAVGFELIAGPEPLSNSALLDRAQNDAPGASAQIATFNIPGSEMDFQLIQFSGIEGNAFSQRLYDPGVTRFSIQVRDIEAAFAAISNYDITVDSTGGEPVYTQRPRNETRAIMTRDPDGFVLEFVQSGNPIVTDVPESSNIYNARSSLALDNRERSLAFYRDILGYEANDANPASEAVLQLEGTPDSMATITRTQPPGSTNVWFFWEFSDIDRTKREPNVQDPGASAISLLVEGLPALLDEIREGGFTIESPAGQMVDLEGSARGVLVRSPDGLLVELVEAL